MDHFKLEKKNLAKIFFIQFGDILIYETGLIIIYYIFGFSLLFANLILTPIYIVIIISKYTKSITLLYIDYKNQKVKLIINYFLFFNKLYEIPFEKLSIVVKWKWLTRFYCQMIEIKESKKSIAVIPFKWSIWNKKEITLIIKNLKKVEKFSSIRS